MENENQFEKAFREDLEHLLTKHGASVTVTIYGTVCVELYDGNLNQTAGFILYEAL